MPENEDKTTLISIENLKTYHEMSKEEIEASKPKGKLTIGDQVFDGTQDVNIPIYQGN